MGRRRFSLPHQSARIPYTSSPPVDFKHEPEGGAEERGLGPCKLLLTFPAIDYTMIGCNAIFPGY